MNIYKKVAFSKIVVYNVITLKKWRRVMKSRNICKFTEEVRGESLTTKSFIFESKPEIMRNKVILKCNRIMLISQAGASFCFDGESVKVTSGDLVFAFAGERFFAEPYEGCEYLYIEFEGSRCNELFNRFGIHPLNRCFSSNEGLIAFWNEAISRAAGINLDLISESVVLYSFSQLAENCSRRYGIAEQLISIVNEEFSNSELSLESVSKRLGFNSKYLSHTFKEKTGRSFSEYLRTVRIRHAVFLMDNGLESVKNIAYFCGYSDQLYFSSVFKKVIGVSPTVYINKSAGDKHSAV